VGLSRKSMFYKPLKTPPDEVLAATVAANTLALQNGADILRVHDVKEAVQAIAVWERVKPKT
jgi:dihydropteroate synthase